MTKLKNTSLAQHSLALLVGTGISCILLIIRFFFSQRENFAFLTWNIFLAWIPCILSLLIFSHFHKIKRNYLFLTALFFSWLLFFPNSAYVITDLIHIKHRYYIPLWYDILLIGSFGLNGLLIGLFSLSHIHQIVHQIYGKKVSWGVIAVLAYLNGLGIYLGRVLRWNSWDIFSHPFHLAKDIIKILNPFEFPKASIFTLFFTIGFMLFYIVAHRGFYQKQMG